MFALAVNDVYPSQPMTFVSICPQRSVALPQTSHLAVVLPIVKRFFYGFLRLAYNVKSPLRRARDHRGALFIDGCQQLVERVIEFFDPVGKKLIGSLVQRNTDSLQGMENLLGLLQLFYPVFDQSWPRPAMSLKFVVCLRGKRVYSVGAYQFVDVLGFRILWVLCAGARPQKTL